MAERKVPLTFEVARFIKFMITEIFPGGRLPTVEMVEEHATRAGFTLTRVQSLQPHYASTLDLLGRRTRSQQRQGHRGPVRRGI